MNFVARFLKNFFPILSIFDYNFWSREFIRNASLVKWREKWTWKRGQCNLEALPRIQKTLMHFQLEDLCLQRHKWCLKKWMCFQTRVFVPNKESFLRGRGVMKAKDGFHSLWAYYEQLITYEVINSMKFWTRTKESAITQGRKVILKFTLRLLICEISEIDEFLSKCYYE